jgi:Pvc16 N-terminal domain
MAGFKAIAAAAKSIERLLTKRFTTDAPVPGGNATKAVLVRTDDFDLTGNTIIKPPVLTLFLVRVEVNRLMRPGWSGVGAVTERVHLPLDLHFLLTPWASNAEYEQRILGSAMRCLEETPVLSGPLLDTSNDPQWAPEDAIQVTPGDLGADGIMRIFDTLDADYRLSVPYLARIIRIDGVQPPGPPPVLTAVAAAKPGLEP